MGETEFSWDETKFEIKVHLKKVDTLNLEPYIGFYIPSQISKTDGYEKAS